MILSQSDVNVGSQVTIDRIRIGKNFGSIRSCQEMVFGNTTSFGFPTLSGGFEYSAAYTNTNVVTNSIINTTALPIYTFKVAPLISPVVIEAPTGYKISIQNRPLVNSAILTPQFGKSAFSINDFNDIKVYFVGNANRVNSQGNPIVGDVGEFSGILNIKNVGANCNIIGVGLRGTIIRPTISALDAIVFPNTTNGRIDLKINEKAPEGDFEIQLADNQGNSLFQSNGYWESMKPSIEQILSKSNTGQYFLSIRQGNESKTIRVFRQE